MKERIKWPDYRRVWDCQRDNFLRTSLKAWKNNARWKHENDPTRVIEYKHLTSSRKRNRIRNQDYQASRKTARIRVSPKVSKLKSINIKTSEAPMNWDKYLVINGILSSVLRTPAPWQRVHIYVDYPTSVNLQRCPIDQEHQENPEVLAKEEEDHEGQMAPNFEMNALSTCLKCRISLGPAWAESNEP